MVTYAAILELVGDMGDQSSFELVTGIPNGKSLKTQFTAKDGWKTEVPTLVEYVDDFKQKRVFEENYAKRLLGTHGKGSDFHKRTGCYLKFVKELKRAEVAEAEFVEEQPAVEQPTVEQPAVEPPKKPKGKKQDEKP